MMKSFKKMVGVLLAAVMCLGMCLTGLAAGECSITVENSIGGVTYKLYKIFDATYSISGDGDDAKTIVSYTFDVENTMLSGLVNSSDSPFAATLSADGSVYVVTLKETATDTSVAEWLNKNAAELAGAGTSGGTDLTGNGSSIKWAGLDAGYYLVVPSSDTITSALISVTTAAPNGVIVDKNQYPDLDKGVDRSNYSIGDTANYTIKAYVPTYVGEDEIASYTFIDVMDAGLSYDEGSIGIVITGTGVDTNGDTETVTITLTEGQYTAEAEPGEEGTENEGKTVLTISYNIDDIEGYPADAEIAITYTATVTEKADDIDIHNEVTLTWTTVDGDEPDNPPEDETQSYTFGFELKKADGTDSAAKTLEGAEFTITDVNGEKISFISGNDYYEVYDENDTSVDPATVTDTITVGSASIWGLSEGVYTLTEITAPDGYNILESPIIIVISENTDGGAVTGWTVTVYSGSYDPDNPNENLIGTDEGTIGESAEDTHNVISIPLVTIVNNSGSELPSTGGMGTMIFYIAGILLMIFAAAAFVAKRRIDRKN